MSSHERPGMRLLKKAVAGAAISAATELVGKRLYIAYEAMRRLSSTGQREGEPHGLPPTPEQALEDVVEDLVDRGKQAFDRGKQAFDRHRPMLERARARARSRLAEPRIGAAVVGGSVVGAISALGVLPLTIGAGTAYLVYRRLQREGSRGTAPERPGYHGDDG